MFGKKKSMLAISDINKVVEEKAKVDNALAKTQREKDLKLKTIEKYYDAKIDIIMRKQDELDLIIRDTKEYVNKLQVSKEV